MTLAHKIGIGLGLGILFMAMKKAKYTSPVRNFKIRDCDPHGCGGYEASRKRNGVSVSDGHNGIDIIVRPGESIVAPMSGKVRTLFVNSGSTDMKGIEISSGNVKMKLFYVAHQNLTTGQTILEGDFIGYAQDVAGYYGTPQMTPQMTPHIHVEVYVNGQIVDPTGYF